MRKRRKRRNNLPSRGVCAREQHETGEGAQADPGPSPMTPGLNAPLSGLELTLVRKLTTRGHTQLDRQPQQWPTEADLSWRAGGDTPATQEREGRLPRRHLCGARRPPRGSYLPHPGGWAGSSSTAHLPSCSSPSFQKLRGLPRAQVLPRPQAPGPPPAAPSAGVGGCCCTSPLSPTSAPPTTARPAAPPLVPPQGARQECHPPRWHHWQRLCQSSRSPSCTSSGPALLTLNLTLPSLAEPHV